MTRSRIVRRAGTTRTDRPRRLPSSPRRKRAARRAYEPNHEPRRSSHAVHGAGRQQGGSPLRLRAPFFATSATTSSQRLAKPAPCPTFQPFRLRVRQILTRLPLSRAAAEPRDLPPPILFFVLGRYRPVGGSISQAGLISNGRATRKSFLCASAASKRTSKTYQGKETGGAEAGASKPSAVPRLVLAFALNAQTSRGRRVARPGRRPYRRGFAPLENPVP